MSTILIVMITGLILVMVCINMFFADRYKAEYILRIILLNLIGILLSANMLLGQRSLWQIYGLFFIVFGLFVIVFYSSVKEFFKNIVLFCAACFIAFMICRFMDNDDETMYVVVFAMSLYIVLKAYKILDSRDTFVVFTAVTLMFFSAAEIGIVNGILKINNLYVTILLILMSMLLFIVIEYFHDMEIVYLERQIMNNQISVYKEQVTVLKTSENFTRGIRHDIKNHMQVLYGLIDNNELDNAKSYIDDITEKVNQFKPVVNTGNIELDSIINGKINIIKSLDFQINKRITIPENMPIDAYDMVVVAGNLFDNAINAEKKISGVHIIEFSMVYNKGMLMIRMCNGCNKIKNKEKTHVTVSNIPPEMKSKDMDLLIHGYGIKNVLNVVEKYQGSMYFEILDGRWIVDVNMILPTF